MRDWPTHVALAQAVADFLKALRRAPAVVAPLAGAHNFHRGGSLAIYDAEARAAIRRRLRGEIDVLRALAVWDDGVGDGVARGAGVGAWRCGGG